MLRNIAQSKTGFTLLELLVVIALLGVMASSVVILINPLAQLQRSRDAQRKSDLRQIQSALEMYRSDNGSYPATLPSCGGQFTNSDGSVIYLSKMPCDPKTGWSAYAYTPSTAPATRYSLTACLENAKDPQRDTSPEVSCSSTGRIITVKNP